MNRTLNSLIVKLGWDPKEVDAGIKRFERNLTMSAKRMESIGRTMSIGFTAPFVLGMRQAIKAYDEEAQVVKKLEVALGKTSEALLKQAALIQKTTVYSDDSVISVQAWAAALGHSEAEIQKMTTAAVGLAAGLGIGLDQAMEMLHKSTLGAAKGLGNLVPGVKDLTKEQLKAGAAVDLVADKFRGYGEAAAKTGLGPLKQLQNQLGDMMEDIGRIAIPFLTKFAEKLKSLAEWFDELAPSTKSFLVEFGALVALAGPVLLFTANIIKLSQAFVTLGISAKGAMGPVGLLLAAFEGMKWFGENIGYGSRFGAGEGSIMKLKHGKVRSSQFGGTDLLLGSVTNPTNSGFLAPPASSGGAWSGGSGVSGGGKRNAADFLVPEGFGNTIGVDPFSSFNPSGQGWETSKLPTLKMGGVTGGISSAFSGIGEITAGVGALSDSFVGLGDIFGAVMGDIITGLGEGGKSFGEYALSAVAAIGKVIQAQMMQAAINIVAGESKKGLVGALIGLAGATAVLAAISSIMSKQKAPALAEGGVAYGPTMAMIGDNRSGKELVMPFEKSGEFAQAIASRLGGGMGSQVVGVIRGDDILLTTSKAQGRATRRGSANVITF